jgi:hypothetical protein
MVSTPLPCPQRTAPSASSAVAKNGRLVPCHRLPLARGGAPASGPPTDGRARMMSVACPAIHGLPGDSSRAPMTEVRQSLARAISALADEVEGPEESMRPAQRLGQLGLDLAALGREIAELTETHQARLAVTSHRLAIRNTRSGVVEQLGELARVLPGRNGGRFLETVQAQASWPLRKACTLRQRHSEGHRRLASPTPRLSPPIDAPRTKTPSCVRHSRSASASRRGEPNMVVCTTSTLTRRSSRTVPQAGFTAYGRWFGFLTLSEPSALATTRSPAHRRATAVGTFARWDSSSICTTPSASCFPGRHRRSGLGWSIGSRERGNRDDPWPHGGLQRMLKGPSSEPEATTASRRSTKSLRDSRLRRWASAYPRGR